MTAVARAFFVDTSYLVELYAVPTWSNTKNINVVRSRFKSAWAAGSRLYVTLGCLLELGNHIGHIKNDEQRSKWAATLDDAVAAAMDDRAKQRPFVVVAAPPLDEVRSLVSAWRAKHVPATRGLVDAATAEKAREFKQRNNQLMVHIWTFDRALKGVEPDSEPEPYLG